MVRPIRALGECVLGFHRQSFEARLSHADKVTFEQLAQALHKDGTADFGGGNTVGYAAKDASSPLEPWAFDRRPAGDEDIVIQIAYCGICHSDVHQIRNEWGNTVFSCVPGWVASSCLQA